MSDRKRVDDVVIFGAGRIGVSVARMLLGQQVRVRLIEADRERARDRRGPAADGTRLLRHGARSGLPRARADRPVARRDLRHARRREEPLRLDAREAARRRVHDRRRPRRRSRRRSSSARASTSSSTRARSRRRSSSASRTTRGRSRWRCSRATSTRCSTSASARRASTRTGASATCRRPGALIGAIVRNGDAIFPHRDDVLRPGDRVIVFSESVARALGREDALVAISRARLRRMTRRETVGVDVAAALNLVGVLLRYLGPAFLVPVPIAFGYDESPWPFVARRASSPRPRARRSRLPARGGGRVGAREGFLVVALTGCSRPPRGRCRTSSPTRRSSRRPSTRYFEAMSGFTTTGASVLTDIEAVNRSLLFWRQFTQWLGGMGIIVLALAVLPRLRVGGRQLFETEAPGPEIEPLAASIRDTARRLWVLYVALTVVCAAIFAVVGWTGIDPEMDLYDAVDHTPSRRCRPAASRRTPTASGGSRRRRSGSRSSSCCSAASNFALLYVAFVRGRVGTRRARRGAPPLRRPVRRRVDRDDRRAARRRRARRRGGDPPRRLPGRLDHDDDRLRDASTTPTGRRSRRWRSSALMFIGGSAGSTTGSVKVVRHLLIGRILRRELDQTVHPELVAPVRLNRRPLDERALRAVIAFVLLYIGLFVVGAVLIAIDSSLAGVDVGAVRRDRGLGGDARQRRPGLRLRRPVRVVRPVQRLLEERDDRADVARPPRDHPGARALHEAYWRA